MVFFKCLKYKEKKNENCCLFRKFSSAFSFSLLERARLCKLKMQITKNSRNDLPEGKEGDILGSTQFT